MQNVKCVLGSGKIYIYRNEFIDPLSYFKNVDNIYIAEDLEDARKHEINIIKGPLDVFWCCPVINGELRKGMFSGAFVHTSNEYSHPIRLIAILLYKEPQTDASF